MNKFVKNKPSLLAGQGQARIADLETSKSLVFSFKHFDPRQGECWEDWQNEKLLARMCERFREHCLTEPFTKCFGERFKQYGPLPTNSRFRHPPHVPQDAVWTSMHIKGEPCVIGHMIRNVFYIVFLDKEHVFYPTTLKHT
jgi:hypothetical protein